MAMTLRLSEEETEALRARAEQEGRSMQEVARQAVRAYLNTVGRADLLERVLDSELPRYAEAIERLGR
jgi:plasmid stability protein